MQTEETNKFEKWFYVEKFCMTQLMFIVQFSKDSISETSVAEDC